VTKGKAVKKIVIAARPYDEHSTYFVQVLGELYPECEMQIECAEAEIPTDSPLSRWSPVSLD
jgi:hypothetical protein